MIRASCELYLDGRFFPSTPADAAVRLPVGLAPLTLEWGRNNPAEQPDTSTVSVTVRVWDPPDDLLELVHAGTDVEIWSTGEIPSPGYGANAYVDGSFELAADGPAGGLAQAAGGTATIAAHALRFDPDVDGASVWLPPAAFTTDPAGWDAIPSALAGQTWQLSVTVTAPAGVGYQLGLTGWTTPAAASRVDVTTSSSLPALVGDGTAQTTVLDVTLTATPGPVWLGIGVALPAQWGRWMDAVGTWDQQTTTWQDYAAPYVVIDNLGLAPPEQTQRRVLVHSGTVSDLAWSAVDDRAVDVDLIAVDMTGDLGQRVIGDTPWPVQTVAVRANRIVTLAGAGTDLRIDSGVGGYQLSGRDVDAQPALDLLRDVAQSAGGVLWPATHATTGPYLWLEDPRNRAAVRELVVDPDTGLIVIDNPRAPGDVALISACDLLRVPVAWRQSTSDVVTTVDLTWLEQTLNEDGELDPTERHVIRTDPAAIERFGVNRESLSTELIAETDAENLADRLLAGSSRLNWRVDGITYDTGLVDPAIDSLDNTTRMQALMDLLDGTTRNGLAVNLVDLPTYAPIPGDTAGTYVEGGTYTYENDAWTLSLKLSPTPAAGQSAAWEDVPAGWSWDMFSPGISWADLTGTVIGD